MNPIIRLFKGRISRIEYVGGFFVLYLTIFISVFLVSLLGYKDVMVINYVAYAIGIPLSLGLFIRRMHDLGQGGWMLVLLFVPILNLLYQLYLLFAKGQDKENIYGPIPKNMGKNQLERAVNVIFGIKN